MNNAGTSIHKKTKVSNSSSCNPREAHALHLATI